MTGTIEEYYAPNSTYWCCEDSVTFKENKAGVDVKRSVTIFVDGKQVAYKEDLYAYNIKFIETKDCIYTKGSRQKSEVDHTTPYNKSTILIYFSVLCEEKG